MVALQLKVVGLAELLRLAQQGPSVVDRYVRAGMEGAVAIVHAEVAERTPVDTGILRGSLFTQTQGAPLTGLRGIVATPISYAPLVERGTRPHVIQGKGQRLRFSVNGRVVWRWYVRHPGTRGAHMFRNGLRAARPKVERIFQQAQAAAVHALQRGG